MFAECSTRWLCILLHGNEHVCGYWDLAKKRRHLQWLYPENRRWTQLANEAQAHAVACREEIYYRLFGELVPSGD